MQPLLIILAIATVALGVLAWLGRPSPTRPQSSKTRPARGTQATSHYPGDFTGRLTVEYAPKLDGAPDPGEVVWTWVPFEEDHEQGKDRPVLLVGRDGRWLLGLQLSSQDRSTSDAPHGQRWVEIGSGSWDSRRRPSTVRVDRIVRVDPAVVRRQGAILDRTRFNIVAHSLKRL